MNREIKFKAWNGDRMLYFENGDFFLKPNGKIEVPSSTGHEFYERDYPVMQFTGLKDKEGNEIYEGDVVKRQYGVGIKGVVQYGSFLVTKDNWGVEHWATGWHLNYEDGSGSTPITNEYTIIGNIHENPELLKQKSPRDNGGN